MSIRGIVRSAAIGAAIYGVAKAGELVGLIKGVVKGCQIAQEYPEDAAQVAAEWDEIDRRWNELKDHYKKA